MFFPFVFCCSLGGVCADLSSFNIYDYDTVIEDKIHNVD